MSTAKMPDTYRDFKIIPILEAPGHWEARHPSYDPEPGTLYNISFMDHTAEGLQAEIDCWYEEQEFDNGH